MAQEDLPATPDPIVDEDGLLSPEELAERDKFRVGTLVYSRLGLVGIFGWMIWGTLCFNLFETAGGPDILKLYLQDNFHVSNLQVNILFNFIPMIIGTVMTPIISFKSDRTRSRLGRRIPYILYTAPFLVLFAIGLGFSDDIVSWCKLTFSGKGFVSPFTAALIIIGFLTVGFSLFNEFVGTVYYYLLPDVMPANFIGRFTAVSSIFGLGASIAINLFITPYKLTHIKAIHVGVAILYFVGLGLVCWRVKEGQYPPVEDVSEKTRLWDQIRLYFRECFSHPIFILFYISTAVTMLARGLNPAGVFSLHLSEHQSGLVAQSGKDNCVVMTPDGRRVITGGEDGTLKLIDCSKLNKPMVLTTLRCAVGEIKSIAITDDGIMAVVGGSNGMIQVWDLKAEGALRKFEAHAGGVTSVAISPDGRQIASGGADNLVCIWDLNTGQLLHRMSGHAAAKLPPLPNLWRRFPLIDFWQAPLPSAGPAHSVNCVAFASTGDHLASGGADGVIDLWNSDTGTLLKKVTGSPGPIYAVGFMPSLVKAPEPLKKPGFGAWVSRIAGDVGHFLHNVFTDESFYDPQNPPDSAVSKPDAWIISGGRDGPTDIDYSAVRIWDVSHIGNEAPTFFQRLFSPSGLLDAFSPQPLYHMKGHKRAVTSVLYKKDLHLVLSGSQDESIRLWMPLDLSSTADDQSYKTFSGYTHAITSIACSMKGVGLVDASTDGKLQFWDIDQGISLAKGGLQAVFFAIVGMLTIYPIGAFVDGRNPLVITIIATLLGLPIILSYYFFLHTYIYGFWASFIQLPLGQLITCASVPMLVLLYPKSKYGQFASANALVRQAVGAAAGIFGAVVMDRLTAYSLNTDAYRYGYIFQFIVHAMSMCALIGVYVYWRKLGGPNYVAPESTAKKADPQMSDIAV